MKTFIHFLLCASLFSCSAFAIPCYEIAKDKSSELTFLELPQYLPQNKFPKNLKHFERNLDIWSLERELSPTEKKGFMHKDRSLPVLRSPHGELALFKPLDNLRLVKELLILDRLNQHQLGVKLLGYGFFRGELGLLTEYHHKAFEPKYLHQSTSQNLKIHKSALKDIRDSEALLLASGVNGYYDMQFLISSDGRRALLFDTAEMKNRFSSFLASINFTTADSLISRLEASEQVSILP